MNNSLSIRQPQDAIPGGWRREMSLPEPQDYLTTAWQALKRHRGVALALVAAGTLLVLCGLWLSTPTYSATAVVMVDGRRAMIIKVGNGTPDIPIDLDTVSNEVQLIASRDLVESVVRQLDLESIPSYDPNRIGRVRGWLFSLLAELRPWLSIPVFSNLQSALERPVLQGRQYTDAVIDAVVRNLDVAPVGRSRTISLTFTAQKPEIAQTFVNALAQRYVDHQIEMKQQTTEDANRRITQQLAGLKKSSAEAAKQVEKYRVELGLVDGRDTTLIRQQISETSSQLTASERDRLAAAAKLRDVERAAATGADGSEEILKSVLIQQLRLQQAQISRETAPARVAYGERHPSVEVSRTQLSAIQRRIDQETQKIVTAVRGEYQASLERESGLRKQVGKLTTEMGRLRESEVALDQLSQNANAAKEIYEAFLRRARETDVGGAMQSPDAYIIAHAATPISPVSPKPQIVIPVGMAMSGLLSVVGILAFDARNRGFFSQAQVSRELDLPTLGMIPELRRTRAPNPLSLIGTAMTDLFMQIVFSLERNSCILITSAVPGEGKTTVGLALARIAARNGKRTLFVDADMRRFDRNRNPLGGGQKGLMEVLSGQARLSEVVFPDNVAEGVSVLARGGPADNPAELICSTAMRNLLKEARGSYDLVFIDSPPVMVGPEAWMLANFVDATILFVRWRWTSRRAVRAASDKLMRTGAKISGVVLTMVDIDRVSRYSATDGELYSKIMRKYYAKGSYS